MPKLTNFESTIPHMEQSKYKTYAPSIAASAFISTSLRELVLRHGSTVQGSSLRLLEGSYRGSLHGGSRVVISGVISPLIIWAISIVTLLITPFIYNYRRTSKYLEQDFRNCSAVSKVEGYRDLHECGTLRVMPGKPEIPQTLHPPKPSDSNLQLH